MNNSKMTTIISVLMDECYFPGMISAMTGATKEEINRIERQRDQAWNEDDVINRASYYSSHCDKWFID